MSHYNFSKTSELLWNTYELNSLDSPSGCSLNIPHEGNIRKSISQFLSVLLPSRFSEHNTELNIEVIKSNLEEATIILSSELEKVLPGPNSVLSELLESLPSIRLKLLKDIEAAFKGDPAAASYQEVIVAYPSIFVISTHRISHELYKRKVPLIPRMISEWAHSKTGIDIHPGAVIDEGFFVDHGTGVVIGETSRIGKQVKIYQGVTLGARSFSYDQSGALVKGEQRHPLVEDNVVIYANATILGGETCIGRGSIIGANVFLMESVPPDSLVVSEATPDSSAKNFTITSRQ